jgi:hypothetical protein
MDLNIGSWKSFSFCVSFAALLLIQSMSQVSSFGMKSPEGMTLPESVCLACFALFQPCLTSPGVNALLWCWSDGNQSRHWSSLSCDFLALMQFKETSNSKKQANL